MDQMLDRDVTLALEGDESAFMRLVEQTDRVVCSIALSIVRNVDASEDVAQEVFLAAWHSLRKLSNPASFLPWIRQITRNQAHHWIRQHRRELTDELTIAAAVDRSPLAEQQLLEAEERVVLQEVLDALPEDVREVVTLFYREGGSAAQVADLLGLSEAAVKQRLSRARKRIREEVLARFGATVSKTAPGAAFVTVVGAALTGGAPPAAAAVAAVAGGKSAAIVSWAALAGSLLGILGVFLGIRRLAPYYDELEKRELFRFGGQVSLVVAATAVVLTWIGSQPPPRWSVLVVAAFFIGALHHLYGRRLPRILQRRWAWECSINPEVAAQTQKKWLATLASTALASALGGVGIMMIVIRWMQ